MDMYTDARGERYKSKLGERYKSKLVEGDVDAAMEAYKKYKSRVRISVEGYDTSLPEDDIKKALVDHFMSCGEIIRVTVPIDPETRLVERRAFMILRGDGAEEKALQLDGSVVGGCNVFVRVTPEDDEETDRYAHALLNEVMHDPRYKFGVVVCGYDTSLPHDDVKSTLKNHFSSCGDITCVLVGRKGRALIYFTQEEAEGKALKLNGSQVGGWKVTVGLAATAAKSALARAMATASRFPFKTQISVPRIDSCIPSHIVFLTEEINEKIMAFKKKRGLV